MGKSQVRSCSLTAERNAAAALKRRATTSEKVWLASDWLAVEMNGYTTEESRRHSHKHELHLNTFLLQGHISRRNQSRAPGGCRERKRNCGQHKLD